MCIVSKKYDAEESETFGDLQGARTKEDTVAIYDHRDFDLNKIRFEGKYASEMFTGYLEEFGRKTTFEQKFFMINGTYRNDEPT